MKADGGVAGQGVISYHDEFDELTNERRGNFVSPTPKVEAFFHADEASASSMCINLIHSLS
jgi:hypothetical protein